MPRHSTPSITRLVPRVALIGLALLAGACCHLCHRQPPAGVDLEPNDPRPVLSIQVGDSDEAALLEQELDIEPLRIEGPVLYFFAAEGLEDRLRDLGYQPATVNPYQVYRRVVRIERRGSEEQLAQAGVRLINREKGYWVVEASLANLRALAGSGYRLSPPGRNEPRPREIRIALESREQLALLTPIQLDIYNIDTTGDTGQQGAERYPRPGVLVYAGAFDHQIDQLRAAGLEVERISTVNPPNDEH